MPIVNEGLEEQMQYVTKPSEEAHIRSLWDEADPLMQQISLSLIMGKNDQVDELTQEALGKGFSANTILDDGLIAGMAIVGVKFRDNI
ncbi:MAG: B12-binding domain-containing protein, partial [Dehalococcoidia bacterium]|nr:B12-binding domain-containing protein [Dehalococcoidia bacterium]